MRYSILAEIVKKAEEIKPSQQAKRDVLRKYKVSSKEDRIYTKLFYGIMRYQGILDDVIKKIIKIDNVNILDPWFRAALRVSIYEFIIDKRIARKKLINLRKDLYIWLRKNTHPGVSIYYLKIWKYLWDNKRQIYNSLDKEVLKLLLPKWFINKLKELLNEKEVEELAKYFNKIPKISIRVNLLKSSIDEIKNYLENLGKSVKHGKYLKEILKFDGPIDLESLDIWKEGKIIVQEEASALASIILNPKPNEIVIDMCAAPGGKTEHIAELMKLKGKIYAFDINPIRIKRMKDLLKRTETIDIVEIFKKDARNATEVLGNNIADKILLDAPCTSSGTIHKNPELRWRLDENKIKRSQKLQRELLEEATKLLKPKGILLYTTCSLFKEENEDNVTWFLRKFKNFELIEINYGHKTFIPKVKRIWPHRDDTIGFFYAKLKKKVS